MIAAGVRASECITCHWRGFPQRLWCPTCGGDVLEERVVHVGTVVGVTIVRRAPGRSRSGDVRIGRVALLGGGHVIARLDAVGDGARVRLTTEDGAPVARRL